MLYPLLQASYWPLFIGRFHPVLVHLPIGFLFVALLLEIGRRTGKINVSESAISFVLFWSAVGATFACVAGYLLSLSGGYDNELLMRHQWQGIGVAAFAWVAWVVKSDLLGEKITIAPLFYLPAFGIATVLTMTAGHDGGSLTHGEGFLTQYTPEPFRSMTGMAAIEEQTTEIKPIANVNQALVYGDIVRPILEARCTQCHNASKQKGDLRLDQVAFMLKGGKDGPAFVAGKSAESELIKRCLLPENDDDRMPPKGKPQLTDNQITLLSWWIDNGAPTDKKVSELKVSEEIKPALAALGNGSVQREPNRKTVFSEKVEPANEEAIAALRKIGLVVNPVAQDQNFIEVSAINVGNFSDANLTLLTPLSDQIVWLKLGKTKVTDAGMEQISTLKNLNRLHIEYTAVSDEGLKMLKGLPYLEYLNLIGAKVTDKGLNDIAAMKSLRSLYVWKTEASDSGIIGVRKANPGLTIVAGPDSTVLSRFKRKPDSTAVAL
ncbi:ribonuclease inhibitor [Dyadobacter luteus]|uniref:Ribonuclease inhibitor n=1 Tax=Dyadobacter luteus TaxID=2259619 RepID=A0A3D8YB35_9BACT|nr:c-type cytochrome domain-containing protein [Dyadobacter luteus]REA60439.1 ribonuclease inhibitor [Dyadobacter luteus]